MCYLETDSNARSLTLIPLFRGNQSRLDGNKRWKVFRSTSVYSCTLLELVNGFNMIKAALVVSIRQSCLSIARRVINKYYLNKFTYYDAHQKTSIDYWFLTKYLWQCFLLVIFNYLEDFYPQLWFLNETKSKMRSILVSPFFLTSILDVSHRFSVITEYIRISVYISPSNAKCWSIIDLTSIM